MQDQRPTQLTDSFLARQLELARNRDNNDGTLTDQQREQFRRDAAETLEIVLRLRSSKDFQLYHLNQRHLVLTAKQKLLTLDLPEEELTKAKARYLACLEMYNVLDMQEITARRLISPSDPRIIELEAQLNSHLTSP